jgi:hypothetical protein
MPANLSVRVRRTKRTLIERALGWERAYEGEATLGFQSVHARGKSVSEAEASAIAKWERQYVADPERSDPELS